MPPVQRCIDALSLGCLEILDCSIFLDLLLKHSDMVNRSNPVVDVILDSNECRFTFSLICVCFHFT